MSHLFAKGTRDSLISVSGFVDFLGAKAGAASTCHVAAPREVGWGGRDILGVWRVVTPEGAAIGRGEHLGRLGLECGRTPRARLLLLPLLAQRVLVHLRTGVTYQREGARRRVRPLRGEGTSAKEGERRSRTRREMWGDVGR